MRTCVCVCAITQTHLDAATTFVLVCICVCLFVYMHMGWLRLVGSLKLHVSFAEYSPFYRALLRKRPIILRSLLIVATPYVYYMYRLSFSFERDTLFRKRYFRKRPTLAKEIVSFERDNLTLSSRMHAHTI